MKTQLIILAIGAVFVGLMANIGSASAHARLKTSTPKVGEVVAASPASVSITFSNDIQKIAGSYGIDVTNEAGATVTDGAATIKEDDRSVLSVPLQPNLAAGRYVVKYKNVSDADGDPFEAGYAFYVGVQPTADQLALDAALEQPEVSATQASTAQSGATPVVTTGRSPAIPATAASSTPIAAPPKATDDGDSSTAVFVVAAIIAVVAIAGGAVMLLMRRRS